MKVRIQLIIWIGKTNVAIYYGRNKKTWGGARKGAGRKPKEHSVLSIRVTPETALWIQEYSRSTGISQGAVVDLLVEKMKASMHGL